MARYTKYNTPPIYYLYLVVTLIAYVHSPILAKVLSILLKLDIELPRISEKGGAIQDLILIRFNFYVYVLLFIILFSS
jgi:hypothetical protein